MDYRLRNLIPDDELKAYVLDAVFDDTGRLFLVERTGQIWIFKDGHRLQTPFLDVSSLLDERVAADSSEVGLHGLVFDPDYAENGTFYITYEAPQSWVVLARYHVSADDPDRADPESAEIVLHLQKQFTLHTMAQLLFGTDGYLYIGMGDWGPDPFGNPDPLGTGQRHDEIYGSILRVDVHSDELPFGIPPDNPYVGVDGYAPQIWVYGLRNPSRFSFDRETGDLYIGDVGVDTWEEINIVPAGTSGQNFGWSFYEGYELAPNQGASPFNATIPRIPTNAEVVWPALVYKHEDGNCAIIGGYVYRGETLPDLQGVYLYGDVCSGRIWAAKMDEGILQDRGLLFDTDFLIGAFTQDTQGEVYVIDYRSGQVAQITSAPSAEGSS